MSKDLTPVVVVRIGRVRTIMARLASESKTWEQFEKKVKADESIKKLKTVLPLFVFTTIMNEYAHTLD